MRITIAKKLWFSFGILILVLSFSGLVSYLQIQKLNDALKSVLVVSEPMENALLEIEVNIDEIARAVYGYLRTDAEWHLETAQKSESSLKHFISEFMRLGSSDLERSLGSEIRDFYNRFRKLSKDIISLVREKQVSRTLLVKHIKKTNDLLDRELQGNGEKPGPEVFKKREYAFEMKIALMRIFEEINGQISESNSDTVKKIKIASADFETSKALFEKGTPSQSEVSSRLEIHRNFQNTIENSFHLLGIKEQLLSKIEAFEQEIQWIESLLNERAQPLLREETKSGAEAAMKFGAATTTITLAMAILAILVMGGVTVITTRDIIRSVRILKQGSEKFGRGDLDGKISVNTSDEISELATAFNVMAEKRTEAEEEVRESAEKIKMFSYSVSHDLKSPAIGIYGITKLLQKNYGDMLDEKGKNYCKQILKASKQVASLVEDINVFISTKETPFSFEDMPLKEILKNAQDEVASRLSARALQWLQADNLPEIRADRMSMLRIIRNLVDNALKYGGDSMTEIEIGYRLSDQFHIISVADDGIGLKKEDSKEIFEVFKRKKTSTGVQGTGLGLAIVKEIVARHGGEVWMEPGAEKGVVFLFSVSRSL